MKKYLSLHTSNLIGIFALCKWDSKYIVAGVAVFIIGMQFMEDGFKFLVVEF